MAYFYPFGFPNRTLTSSFAELSVTASRSASVNSTALTASYAVSTLYPGLTGAKGTSYSPGPCPSGYIECPNLLAQVSPTYTMVCLQTGSGCLPGEYYECPASIPGPTTTTTSTTTTSTTTTSTTTTSTTTTSTTTEAPVPTTTTTTSTTTTSTSTTTTAPPSECYTVYNSGLGTSGTIYWTDANGTSRTGTLLTGVTTYVCSRTTPYESPAADVIITPCSSPCTEICTSLPCTGGSICAC